MSSSAFRSGSGLGSTPVASQPTAQAQTQQPFKTLEEIEAEVRAAAQQQQPVQQQQGQAQGRPLTLEEIEREMMSASVQQPPPQPEQMYAQQQQQTPQPQAAPAAPGMTGADLLLKQLGNLSFPPLGMDPSKKTEEQLDLELEARIRLTELAEQRRQRRAFKIQSMSKYNDIMTGGDKEFITRIQLAQLFTQDPYMEDFYCQVHTAITKSRMQAMGQGGPNDDQGGIVTLGADGQRLGVGTAPVRQSNTPKAVPPRKIKETAMQRMTVQVERMVANAQKRSTAAEPNALLKGALGKQKLRSSVTAPRPILQVGKDGQEGDGSTATALTNLLKGRQNQPDASAERKQPLSEKQVLVRLEQLYEIILDLEQIRRSQPIHPPDTFEQAKHFRPDLTQEEYDNQKSAHDEWTQKYDQEVEVMWQALLVQEPLEVSDPHPFISLLSVQKGHKLFTRLIRLLSHSQCLTILILVLACFPQLDVVRNAPILSLSSATMMRPAELALNKRKEQATESYLRFVHPVLDNLVSRLDLKMVAGLVALTQQRWDVASVLATRPGVALFTMLFNRAEMLKHFALVPPPTGASLPPQAQGLVPTPQDVEQWQITSNQFLAGVIPRLPSIFPSTQAQANAFGPGIFLLGSGSADGEVGSKDEQEGLSMDLKDGEVWGLVASFGLQAQPDDQTHLVSILRDKILHTVHSAKKGWVSAQRGEVRLRNVNLFLGGLVRWWLPLDLCA